MAYARDVVAAINPERSGVFVTVDKVQSLVLPEFYFEKMTQKRLGRESRFRQVVKFTTCILVA